MKQDSVFRIVRCAVILAVFFPAALQAATLAAITSPNDLALNVGVPFTYQISATGDQPIVFSFNAPLPAGLALSGSVVTGTPTTQSVVNVQLVASNAAGVTATPFRFTVGPPVTPVITSPLTLFGLTGVPINYTITASGSQPATFSATGLPPGLTNPGGAVIVGLPTQSGSFAVTLNASYTSNGNTALTSQKTLVMTIGDLVPGTDSDGDCFPDDLEVALGSDPLNIGSTPLSLPACAIQPLSHLKLSVKLNFAHPGSDTVTMNGTLPFPPGFSSPGQRIVVYFAGIIRPGTLGSNGTFAESGTKITLKAKSSPAGGNGKFSVTVKGNLAPTLAKSGLSNATIPHDQRQVLIMVIVGDLVFSQTQNVVYSAKAGKTGMAR